MASTSFKTPQNEKIQNYSNKETLRLLTRVLQKCELEKRLGGSKIVIHNFMKRAAFYSGLHPEVLERLRHDASFTLEEKKVNRSDVHYELLNFYLNENKMPTTRQFFHVLYIQDILPDYMDIRSFRKMLVRMNYVWKKVENYGMVIMERPTVTFERHYYLKNIIRCRSENKPIVYIDEAFLVKNGSFRNLKDNVDYAKTVNGTENAGFFIYAMSKNEIVGLKMSNSFGEESYMDWIKDTFLFLLPSPSMIVLNPIEHNSQEVVTLPTIDSLKVELTDWLNYHDVPFNGNMSKVELYSLAEKYTDLRKIYKVDWMLKSHGHEVLRLPDTVRELSPMFLAEEKIKDHFENEWSVIEKLRNPQICPFKMCVQVILKITKDALVSYDWYISKEEESMMNAERKVDRNMDTMMEEMKNMHKSQSDEDSDIPSFSDSD